MANNRLLVEWVLVAASKAETEGFANTSVAFKELAKLWNTPILSLECTNLEVSMKDTPSDKHSLSSHK
jgi:hypothetical protein